VREVLGVSQRRAFRILAIMDEYTRTHPEIDLKQIMAHAMRRKAR